MIYSLTRVLLLVNAAQQPEGFDEDDFVTALNLWYEVAVAQRAEATVHAAEAMLAAAQKGIYFCRQAEFPGLLPEARQSAPCAVDETGRLAVFVS
jgi:hypothetical protein